MADHRASDFMWTPHHRPTVDPRPWSDAIARLSASGGRRGAGLLYTHFGAWPPWLWTLVHGAVANPAVTFYFIGEPVPPELARPCRNCHSLPLDSLGLLDRIVKLLRVPRDAVAGLRRGYSGQSVEGYHGTRKLCDLKPLLPALFPELTARHEWIGYADNDIVLGELGSEFERLSAEDELLVPSQFYPEPLANGNLLFMRTSAKLVHAFRRAAWLRMLRTDGYTHFDEYGGDVDAFNVTGKDAKAGVPDLGPRSTLAGEGNWGMRAVYMDLVLSGELNARPTRRLLIQDTVVVQGTVYPTISSYGARVGVRWQAGRLTVSRYGPCVCPNDIVPQFGLTQCERCIRAPGKALLGQPWRSRRLEVLGFHYQAWKKAWRRAEYRLLVRHNWTRPHGARRAVPAFCPRGEGFTLSPRGFNCTAYSRLM